MCQHCQKKGTKRQRQRAGDSQWLAPYAAWNMSTRPSRIAPRAAAAPIIAHRRERSEKGRERGGGWGKEGEKGKGEKERGERETEPNEARWLYVCSSLWSEP